MSECHLQRSSFRISRTKPWHLYSFQKCRHLICTTGLRTQWFIRHCATHKIQSVPQVTPMELEPDVHTPGKPPCPHSLHISLICSWHTHKEMVLGLSPFRFLTILKLTNTKDRASKPHCFTVIPNCSKPTIILDFTCLEPGNRNC